MISVLLASCRSSVDPALDSTQGEKHVVSLIEKQGKSSLSGISGALPASQETATLPDSSETPIDETQESMPPTSAPRPTATPAPAAITTPTPLAVPGSSVTVPYAEIFPGGSEMSRNRPLDFAIKTNFSSTISTMLLLSGFLTYQGQDIPAESGCGLIPEESQARLTWIPEPSLLEPGDHSFNDWGHILPEYIPVDATHITVMFTISRQSDAAIEYCIQKTYRLTDEPAIPPPPDDPAAIKVMGTAFWPEGPTVDRTRAFDFGARLDFESIVMTQVRMLVFFTYPGQELPGESSCMSGQAPEQSGGTRFNTGGATRMWTGISRFERSFSSTWDDPGDATHLVMWLLLEGMSGQPIYCWQKVLELSPPVQ